MRARRNDEANRSRRRKPLVAALVLTSLSELVVSGCASNTTAQRAARSAPKQIVATPTGGSAGVGPIMIPDRQQDVVLPDRTLTVKHAVRELGASANSASIRVDVVIRNGGPTTITDASAFFRLMGPEGDIFGVKPGTSTSLDGTIDAHTSRTATMSFEVPAAATSNLHLLYRPGLETQTVMIALNVG